MRAALPEMVPEKIPSTFWTIVMELVGKITAPAPERVLIEVEATPEASKVAPPETVTELALEIEPVKLRKTPKANVPAEMVIGPVNPLELFSKVSLEDPVFTDAPEPVNFPR